MPNESMTSRERWLAALDGGQTDRFPVWLKASFPHWRAAQPDVPPDMDGLELQRLLGQDPLADDSFLPPFEPKNACRTTIERTAFDGGVRATHITETPDGPLVGVYTEWPGDGSRHTLTHPAATAEGLERLRWVYRWAENRDARQADLDPELAPALSAARKEQEAVHARRAADGIPLCGYLPCSPLMELIKYQCGLEAFAYLMADRPELVEEAMALIHMANLRRIRYLTRFWKGDFVLIIEDASTLLHTPAWFRQYSAPHLTDYCNELRNGGIRPVLHLCGHLKAILGDIARIPAAGVEAYTTPPVGDATLAEGRRHMPDHTLLGGANAALLLRPVEEIISAVRDDLSRCPDRRRIILTSGGVLPPAVSFAKARRIVSEFKKL